MGKRYLRIFLFECCTLIVNRKSHILRLQPKKLHLSGIKLDGSLKIIGPTYFLVGK